MARFGAARQTHSPSFRPAEVPTRSGPAAVANRGSGASCGFAPALRYPGAERRPVRQPASTGRPRVRVGTRGSGGRRALGQPAGKDTTQRRGSVQAAPDLAVLVRRHRAPAPPHGIDGPAAEQPLPEYCPDRTGPLSPGIGGRPATLGIAEGAEVETDDLEGGGVRQVWVGLPRPWGARLPHDETR